MAVYQIKGVKKAYVNVFTGNENTDGPRLVEEGATVTVADNTIPSEWMRPKDAAAKAAVALREKTMAKAKANEIEKLRARLAELEGAEASEKKTSKAA